MQRILVNLTNDFGGNQLNHNNDLPAIILDSRAFINRIDISILPSIYQQVS